MLKITLIYLRLVQYWKLSDNDVSTKIWKNLENLQKFTKKIWLPWSQLIIFITLIKHIVKHFYYQKNVYQWKGQSNWCVFI